MNFTRLKNIYTLGPSQRSLIGPWQRRTQSDLFEKDPFKVQSYKFHYAERPRSSQNQRLVSSKNTSNNYNNNNNHGGSSLSCTMNKNLNNLNHHNRNNYDKRFETYYMNRNFVKDNNENHNGGTSSKFFEARRRKYAQEYRNPFRTSVVNIPGPNFNSFEKTRPFLTPTTSPFLKSVCNREDMRKLQPRNSCSSVASSIGSLRSRKSSYGLVLDQKRSASTTASSRNLKASKSFKMRDNSVCQININIKRNSDLNSPEGGNFTIEIETDKKNPNVKINKSTSNLSKEKTSERNLNLTSNKSFTQVKNFSKVSLPEKYNSPSTQSVARTESSASTQLGLVLHKSASINRFPSLVPWRSNSNCRDCFQGTESSESTDGSQDLTHKSLVRANTSLCALRGSVDDCPRRLGSFTNVQNNLNNPSKQITSGARYPRLNFPTKTPCTNFFKNLDSAATNDLSVIRPMRARDSSPVSVFIDASGGLKTRNLRL